MTSRQEKLALAAKAFGRKLLPPILSLYFQLLVYHLVQESFPNERMSPAIYLSICFPFHSRIFSSASVEINEFWLRTHGAKAQGREIEVL